MPIDYNMLAPTALSQSNDALLLNDIRAIIIRQLQQLFLIVTHFNKQ
jgi:hypothetical protein